jgi:hypothetical protein
MEKDFFENEYGFEIYDKNNVIFFKYPIDIKWETNLKKFLNEKCGVKLLNSLITDKYKLFCFDFPKNLTLHRLNYEPNFSSLQIDLILTDDSPLLSKWNTDLCLKIEKEGIIYYHLREFLITKNTSELFHTNFIYWDWYIENKEKVYLWYKNNKKIS